ncbi:MAG: GNAT family N-acetyltransferase, partial [Pseudomonadota bacterium]
CLANYTIKSAEAELSSVETTCCIGLADSEPSGYYIVKTQAPPVTLGFSASELKQIYIVDSAYGNGLGQALYGHALEAIRLSDSEGVWLCVSNINYRAQAFYKKLGFETMGAGPVLEVGQDRLQSSILAHRLS